MNKMHHSLRLYNRYRQIFLRYYIFQARWTRIPLLGRLIRRIANLYGSHVSAAYLLTLKEANEIIDASEAVALGPCTCRTVFHNCDNQKDTEIMIGLTRNILMEQRPQDYREITKQEAKEVLSNCHQSGLIHTIVKCREDFYAICNCCSCCCVPLRLNKKYGIGNALLRNDDIVQQLKTKQR